jgi:hypothetical protein
MTAEKIREDRLRRAARRQGFQLRKSRTRDPRAYTYGVYYLISVNTDRLGSNEHGLSLDEVERFLTE